MLFEGYAIDKTIPVPMYYQLKQFFLEEFQKGTLKQGDMIPTEAELGKCFDISRTTIRQALQELEKEGYLERYKGKGTIVSSTTPKLQRDFMGNTSFAVQIKKSGRVPSTKLLSMGVEPAAEKAAQMLKLPLDTPIIHIQRLRFADDIPVVLVKTYLPIKFKMILQADLNLTGIWDFIATNFPEDRMVRSHRKIEAVLCESKVAELLNIQPNDALQLINAVGYNAAGTPIAYNIAAYPGDRTVIEVETYTDELPVQ